MATSEPTAHMVIPSDTALYRQLQDFARQQRVVFFAGLPGTGKSLLMQQLAHVAAAHGRTVHLLQWDVARPVFEASPAGQRYPVVEGVTHGVIRKAVGMWARQALARWHQYHAEAQHVLLGETPFIGHRLVEFAWPQDDAAETLLREPVCCFAIPVPSRAVRTVIELQRQQRSVAPLHPQETEDAPPQVLHALWRELYDIAPHLGIPTDPLTDRAEIPYDPDVYRRVYQAVLTHRHYWVLDMETRLPTTTLSPYRFAIEKRDLIPHEDEVSTYIRAAEQLYPEPYALQREIEQWYRPPLEG